MPDKNCFRKKFMITVNKQYPKEWLFGANITHSWDGELYLMLYLFKVTVAIGYMYDYDDFDPKTGFEEE